MYLKLLKNDIRKNPGSNLSVLFFVALSVSVTAAVVLMLVQLFSSITSLYEEACPPHFLQLHKGEFSQQEIDSFNESYQGITDWQTVSMITAYGDQVTVEGKETFSLADCRIDLSLVKQNEEKDLLLDKNRKKIQLSDGEIGVPVILLETYPFAIGDTIRIRQETGEREFRVAAFVYDAQMNSTMCSSTRFLLSDSDFDELFETAGETEYIVEAWFEDKGQAPDYQSAYEQAGLPQNGQAVTYTMIFLLSAMTDIMMAMVFLLVGALLILIAFLCMKYTMMASFEEELTEIGTMKALGIPYRSIQRLYLGKMSLLMGAGTLLGFFVAFPGTFLLNSHMNRTFGKQSLSSWAVLAAIVSCILLFLLFLCFCRRILKKLKKVTVTDALVTQEGFHKGRKLHGRIYGNGRLPVNLKLGCYMLRNSCSQYAVVFLVLFATALFVLIPQNLTNTMQERDFCSYMGSSVHDVMIEVEQGENVTTRFEKMMEMLSKESGVSVQSTRRVVLKTEDAEGNCMNIHADCGEGSGDGLHYLKGKAPAGENEIALSLLLSEELGKTQGDSLTLLQSTGTKPMIVCGIYQDVTSGGMTAKAASPFSEEEAIQYTIYVDMQKELPKEALVEQWQKEAGNDAVIEFMETFVKQTVGGVALQIEKASYFAFAIGVLLIVLIIRLFMRLRIAGETIQIAYKRALGISLSDVKKQELYPVLIAALLGILSGTVTANLFGHILAGTFLSILGIGIREIQLTPDIFLSWMMIPLILAAVSAAAGFSAARSIRKVNPVEYMNE